MGLNDKVYLTLTWTKGQTEKGVYAVERSNPKAGVDQTLKLYFEYISSYVHFSKLKPKNLNMGVNDKVRTDLDLHKGSNLGMGCMLLKGLTLRQV